MRVVPVDEDEQSKRNSSEAENADSGAGVIARAGAEAAEAAASTRPLEDGWLMKTSRGRGTAV
jgi:hypothetical protein